MAGGTWVLRALGTSLVATCAHCQIVGGYEEFRETETEPPPVHRCDELSDSKTDEVRAVGMSLSKGASGRCFWIDDTEVSVRQYREWRERSPDFDAWDDRCKQWKATPSDLPPPTDDPCLQTVDEREEFPFENNKPARCVDWCDAQAFCRDAPGIDGTDTHLCYKHNTGGSTEPEWGYQDWTTSCSTGGTLYPWGNDAEGFCNVAPCTTFECGARPVGSLADCRGEEGVFDLLGNVREWIFSCAAIDAELETTHCSTKGGSYAFELETCSAAVRSASKSTRSADIGFRCCAELSPEEVQIVGD